MTSVTISNSVTSISFYLFSGCTGLTSVTIPDSVTSIRSNAFYECKGLKNVTIPNSVTNIGVHAFSGCKGLTSVTIPDSVETLSGFDSCTGLKSITIPNSVTSIKSNAFSNCTGLTSVTIPNSVTSIGSDAFSYCTGLTSITIPNSVTSIGSYAFSGCTGMTHIIIPDSVTSIGANAFYGCTKPTIFCSPGTYAQGFAETNNINYECSFLGDSTASLTVNISDTYKGFYIKIMSARDNKVVCTRIIDKKRISLYGLNSAVTYKAEIVSDTGSVLGNVDNIKFKDDFAEITFSDTKPVCSISVIVKGDNNTDMTDYCTVKWYSENNTYIKTGKTIENVAEGDVYKYRITFNSDVLNDNFVTPDEQTVKVNSENTKAECVLKAIPSAALSGKVVDSDGKAIRNASISLTQTINKNNKTSTTVT